MSRWRRTVRNGSTNGEGKNQVPNPQRRKKHLAECADVDHAARIIQPLQSRQRTFSKTIFAVVIIFKRIQALARLAQSNIANRRTELIVTPKGY